MAIALQDGDLLLVQIEASTKEAVDYIIRGGEWLQVKAASRTINPEESHVGLYVEMRAPVERKVAAESPF